MIMWNYVEYQYLYYGCSKGIEEATTGLNDQDKWVLGGCPKYGCTKTSCDTAKC
jgi:hypothetical protein